MEDLPQPKQRGPQKCPECPTICKNGYLLGKHLAKHQETVSFPTPAETSTSAVALPTPVVTLPTLVPPLPTPGAVQGPQSSPTSSAPRTRLASQGSQGATGRFRYLNCDESFTTKYCLKKHESTVHAEKISSSLPIETDISLQNSLVRSSSVLPAGGEKLFTCPFCEWKGVNAAVVKTHIKRKHI